MGRRNLTVHGKSYDVPGYSVFANTWLSNHVRNWYGREVLASVDQSAGWQQRWTSFKWLLLQKTLSKEDLAPVISFPSWHLDSKEADPCWSFDPSALPLADWIGLQEEDDSRIALQGLSREVHDELGSKYASEYEELQLAVRMVDWLVATEGCQNFRQQQAQRLLNSEGLWQTLRSRLMRVWRDIWGEESVDRVAKALLQRLAEPTSIVEKTSPVYCVTGELARLLDAFIMSPANHYQVADLPRPLRGSTWRWQPSKKSVARGFYLRQRRFHRRLRWKVLILVVLGTTAYVSLSFFPERHDTDGLGSCRREHWSCGARHCWDATFTQCEGLNGTWLGPKIPSTWQRTARSNCFTMGEHLACMPMLINLAPPKSGTTQIYQQLLSLENTKSLV
eukprot:symbB.v1.2.016379.t1/scaffold1239.1/size129856/3